MLIFSLQYLREILNISKGFSLDLHKRIIIGGAAEIVNLFL